MSTRTKTPRTRTQGRPYAEKDAVGPETLQRAVRELLERLPPSKVTRAAVARQAGVDPNLIRYYFQDRDSLVLSVVEDIISERAEAARRSPPQGSPEERLRAHIRGFFEFSLRYPYFHRLLLEEVATSKSVRSRQMFHRLNQQAISTYTEVIKDGAKSKTLRQLDPVLLHIAVVGMVEFFLSSRPLLEDAFGKGTQPAQLSDRYADLIVRLAVDGARQRAD